MKTMLSGLLLASMGIMAGQASFVGTGRVAGEPEYVELVINVHSECYPTPAGATAANDKAATAIVHYLNTFVDSGSELDDVLVNGGYTSLHSSYSTNSREPVCRRGFQKNTRIVFKQAWSKDFSRIFNKVQDYVYSSHSRGGSGSGEVEVDPVGDSDNWDEVVMPSAFNSQMPETYADMHAPAPRLTHATRAQLENDALAAAHANALEKFSAAMDQKCPVTAVRTVGVEEQTGYSAPRSVAYESSDSMRGGGSATVSFDDLWVTENVKVTFEFEGGHCQ